MNKILTFPAWLLGCKNTQQSPVEAFKPSAAVIKGYLDDIEKYGQPLDSGLPAYFRKVADYYDEMENKA